MPDESLADALRRFVAELTERIEDRETSVPGEDSPFDPIRGTPLYEAAKAVEKFYPSRRLPVEAWDHWARLLRRADDGKGEADSVERTIVCYRLASKLRRWARGQLKSATAKPPLRIVKATINARMLDTLTKHPEAKDWSKSQWSEHLGCSETGIQDQPTWDVIMKAREEAKREQRDRSRRFLDG